MKRILTLTLILFISVSIYAQTDGISYQAVIIGPDDLELPGVDSEGNYLPTTDISIRFSIIAPGTGIVEFTETQDTTTDELGQVNLIIGAQNHDEFDDIDWNGTPKSLKVEIDFKDGEGFVDMSIEKLTYVPYVAHRNITASGTLMVDGNTTLEGELTVINLATNLGGTLTVKNGNETNLSGNLNVTDQSTTNLSGALIVGDSLTGPPNWDQKAPTILYGSLDVKGKSNFGGLESRTLKVTDSTELNGVTNIISDTQVKITSTLEGSDLDINNYPLLVEGGNQGIAIKVNTDGVKNENNFISFWDDTPVSTDLPKPPLEALTIEGLFDVVGLDSPFEGNVDLVWGGNTVSGVELPDVNGPMLWGRIEGETDESEFTNNADYNMDRLGMVYDLVDGSLDLAWQTIDVIIAGIDWAGSSADVRPCVGFGACVVSPGLSQIAADAASFGLEVVKELAAIANEVFAVRNLKVFDYNKSKFRGVSYASGAGDYAEALLRANPNETMSYGDIVGVNGGRISKNTENAQKIMVVSYKPIVLGALPQPHLEQFYEKVAFMGQVPVKVYGKVNIGDYILPSGNNDGIGIAVSPNKIQPKNIKNIVGVAWETISVELGFNYVNVAVGLNLNDTSPFVEKLETKVSEQAEQIDELKRLLSNTIDRLEALENKKFNSKGDSYHNDEIPSTGITSDGRNYTIENEVIFYEITENDIENGLKLAEEMMKDEGVNTENHIIWKKINEDPSFKNKLKTMMKEKMENHVHYHKEVHNTTKH